MAANRFSSARPWAKAWCIKPFSAAIAGGFDPHRKNAGKRLGGKALGLPKLVLSKLGGKCRGLSTGSEGSEVAELLGERSHG
jgi:hypothetical protein